MKKHGVMSVLMMAVLICLSGMAWADLSDGLIALYPFDGNANDKSGNDYDGVVEGATLTEDRFGNTNSAFNFDGVNDNIKTNLNMSTTFGSGDPVHFSIWFKTLVADAGFLFAGTPGGGPDCHTIIRDGIAQPRL